MGIIQDLLRDVKLPRMVRVRQKFPDNALPDVAASLRAELRAPAIAGRIARGARVAVGVGSRGLADLPLLVRVTIEELKAGGADPFIVPAMGSHGGATAEGQTGMLAALGVTEASAGCPILSSMETVELGTLPNGLPILMDRHAMQADGIVVINRVKPHTSFSGPIESGLTKMIAIGLGKQKGAESCHALGFGEMARNVVEMAKVKLQKAPFLFGIATVENGYDRISRVAAILPEEILEREKQLLLEAKRNMPGILFNPLDVLIVDRMGKEFSGTGMDPNITGRASTPYVEAKQSITRMAVLDLSERTHGNATGMGLADICTRRLFDKIDYQATYANHITSTVLSGGKIPVIMENDRLAVQAAIKTCNVPDMQRLRIVRVPNTLHLETIRISEPMLEEASNHPGIAVLGEPEDWDFDAEGNLAA
ncbi:MAG TPA: lactate racemase domain-containing protein [Acetobacteraceae bacterium]|nr:lactate racemase domain-containing protein [Acetobacteraceae bacterium]